MENGRLPGETVLAYTYFEMYRDAGEGRSLEALGNLVLVGWVERSETQRF